MILITLQKEPAMVRAFLVQFLVFSLESHKKCAAYMFPQKFSTEQEQVTVITSK